MSHLTLETLARLLDDAPDPTEASHLDICASCREELEALRTDSAALRELPDPEPPLANWMALEHRLQREGIMRVERRWTPQLVRLAAALVIFVLGTFAGMIFLRSQNPATRIATNEPEVRSAPIVEAAQPELPASTEAALPVAATQRENVSRSISAPANTPQQAVEQLREAERLYLSALTRYSELAGRTENGDPLARLAALESIVATTRAALGQAPADPVINGYHMTAVAQRDATLRQLAASGQTWY